MLILLCASVPAAAQQAPVPPPAVFASAQPGSQVAGMAADDSGRVWLAVTTRAHGRGVFACTSDQMHRDDLSVFSLPERRACLERWKAEGLLPSPTPDAPAGTGSLTANSESVVCLTDENGDGISDERRVFAGEFSDALDGPAAGVVPLSANAAIFACTPSLWRLEDDNGDGRADRRLPLLTGLGIRTGDGRPGLAAVTLGPDGRIYFATGDRGCRILTSDARQAILEDTGGVFRCTADGAELELLATGLRAPAGIVVDLHGRIFVADAGPEKTSRLLLAVPGADFGWDAALPDHRVFLPGARPSWMMPEAALIDATAAGLVAEPEIENPAAAPLRLLMACGGNSGSLLPLEITAKSASVAVRTGEPRWQGHAACAPVFAADGSLLWAAWEGGFTASASCRILRQPAAPHAAWSDGAALLKKGLAGLPPRDLAALMEHAHPLVRQRARDALVALGFEESLDVFTRVARRAPSISARLNALWGIAALGRAQPMLLSEIALLLNSTEPAVRALAVHILGDTRYAGPPQDILALLRDPAPEVRAAAAIAAGRARLPGAVPALREAFPSVDPADPALRQAFAYALMRLETEENLAALATGEHALPERQCALQSLRWQRSPHLADFITGDDAALAAEAAATVYDLRILPAFPALAALLQKADAPPPLQSLDTISRALSAAQYLGTPEAAAQAADFAARPVEPALQLRALETLAAWDSPPGFDLHGRRALPLPRDNGIARPLLQSLTLSLPPGTDAAAAARAREITAQASAKPTAEQLAATVKSVNLPDAPRIDALHQLAALQPPKALELSRSLLPGGATPRVLAAARTTIMKLDAAASYLQLHDALAHGSPGEMQATLLAAQRFNSKQSDTFWLDAGHNLYLAKIPPPARLEVMEALLLRDNQPRSKWRRLLEAIDADFSEEADPLARWRMCETGGDPDKGRLLFETSRHAACATCHPLHGRGGTTAPDLEGIGKKKPPPDLLAALLHPSDTVVPGYAHVTVTLKSGARHRGQLRRRSDTLTLDTPHGTLQIPAAEVSTISPPESPMPATGTLLTPREIRDLIAFLSTL